LIVPLWKRGIRGGFTWFPVLNPTPFRHPLYKGGLREKAFTEHPGLNKGKINRPSSEVGTSSVGKELNIIASSHLFFSRREEGVRFPKKKGRAIVPPFP